MTDKTNSNFYADLWARRVPQFVATYLGVSWGILQFLIFATNRYDLDASIVDKFLIFVAVMLPGVVMFIYNHGRPGRDKWQPYEKILLPLNFIIAIGLAGFGGKSSQLNAAPVEVKVMNEEGDTITRMVPSMEQSKSIALFPFENNAGDSDKDWMRLGMADLIGLDLEQDMRIYCIDPTSFNYEYQSKNYSLNDNIPFKSKVRIAEENIVHYFISGEISQAEDDYIISVKVIETKNGDEFFTGEYSSPNLYNLVDQFTQEFSGNLFLKDANSEMIEITDLPSTDLISDNIEALSEYYKSNVEGVFNNDIQAYLSKII